jgi:hypothetical protein
MPRLRRIFRRNPSVRNPQQNPCDLRRGVNRLRAAQEARSGAGIA